MSRMTQISMKNKNKNFRKREKTKKGTKKKINFFLLPQT